MGTYLNPGNGGFVRILNRTYVDKTGMLGLINKTIETPDNLTCISRPRRFGKPYAAQMLCAYYDKTCDSSELFSGLQIASDPSYSEHLNKYDVLYLDMTGMIGAAGKEDLVSFIVRNVTRELTAQYPGVTAQDALFGTLISTVELTGNKFISIIDEWDAPIREAKNPEDQRQYLEFLRSLFMNSGTTARIFSAAYMTGILPIKKDGSQSAISDFREYTMLFPWKFAPYVGFTENEVRVLCKDNDIPFDEMKHWYDGYAFPEVGSVHNPNSVMKVLQYHCFDSYWTESSASESLIGYINLNYDGLLKIVTDLISSTSVPVLTTGFANDLKTFRDRNDVLTLLIHLGYLAYDSKTKTARIPNDEIRMEFSRAIRTTRKDETIRRLLESDKLIEDIIHMDEDAVAAQIEKIHAEESPLHYNSEQSLRSTIKRALFSAYDNFTLFEELPAGTGDADVVYLPKQDLELPILMIELKWEMSADTTLNQIRSRNYPAAFLNYCSEILLVGINYDKNAKPGERHHTCKIEKISRS